MATKMAAMHHQREQQLPAAASSSGARAQKIPPFLKKLVDLTNSCPPHIGSWSDDGSHFVVKSSQFADVLREQFQGTLQTFVRQLHFYSFNKKDDGSTGVWTFSHPHFLRGQPHLLANIARKSNPKRSKSKGEDEDEDKDSTGDHSGNVSALEARLAHMERQMSRMNSLEREVQSLKQELVAFKELAVAQNLLSLAPSKKRVCDDIDKKESISSNQNPKLMEKDDMLSLLPPPKKVTRLTSVDSAFELKDFPFEDTSSLGSVSVRDLMRELQYGIFSEFEEFIPAASKFSSHEARDSSVVNEPEQQTPCGSKEDFFNMIPSGFVLAPGVTMPLIRQTFNVIAKQCCPKDGQTTIESLRKLCDEHPHPSTLPPVEQCDIGQALLPILRANVEEQVPDLLLLRAARQVYEIYHLCVMKKLQDKGVCCKSKADCSPAPQ